MNITPATSLERLFTAPVLQADWFAPSFLNQIPLAQIEQIQQQLRTSLGAYQSVQSDGDGYIITFERGQVSAQIALNQQGQITLLLLQPRFSAIAPSEAIQQLQALPGQTNLLIVSHDKELAAHAADQPLAVGSTFKLAVLAALRQQIDRGTAAAAGDGRSWQDVVALRPQDKSLPSGFLQTWFDGAWLTVQTLATLMISQSDNTATDALIHLLGREAIEPVATRNRPFLTTREVFTLKAPQNAALLQQYQTGDVAQRRQVLTAIAALPLPTPGEFDSDRPIALDVEWWFTPRELCHLMKEVADLPLMSVNPGGGLVNPAQWRHVAFKGGSEPGVLNLTTWLESNQGKTYCVSATWNNPEAAVDEDQFFTLYSGVIEFLRTHE